MKKRHFKDAVYTELARITKSLANPHRLEIIELLAQGEFSVEQVAAQTNLSVANASQHLQVLRQAELAAITRQGNFIFYRLSNRNVFAAWKALRELGTERIASIEKVVKEFKKVQKHPYETITIDELAEKIESGKVMVLDVRPENEFSQGHIRGAISMPIKTLKKRLRSLPRRKEIVTYCRGPFCVYADEAAALLNKAGFKARRLVDGFPDWKIKGLPTDVLLN